MFVLRGTAKVAGGIIGGAGSLIGLNRSDKSSKWDNPQHPKKDPATFNSSFPLLSQSLQVLGGLSGGAFPCRSLDHEHFVFRPIHTTCSLRAVLVKVQGRTAQYSTPAHPPPRRCKECEVERN